MNKNNLFKRITHRLAVLYARYVESLPYRNWYNPIITVYLNFRSFPFSQAWKLPVIIYGWPRIYSLMGKMLIDGKCKHGMIEINRTNSGMPNHPGLSTVIRNNGLIIFHGKCWIYTGNKINVYERGVLEFGESSMVMTAVNISVMDKVKIGNYSWVVHRCQVLDTNYHYIADFKHGKVNSQHKPIVIGDYCWICNSSTISGGAIIPDKTIVASHSIVNKDMSYVPEESIIGGQPAKLLSTGYRRVDNLSFENKLNKFFYEHPKELFYTIPSDIDHSICDAE